MKTIPPELADLRRKAHASLGWVSSQSVKKQGKTTLVLRHISEEEYKVLPPTRKSKCRWRADPQLTEELVEAEKAWGITLLQDFVRVEPKVRPVSIPSPFQVDAPAAKRREEPCGDQEYNSAVRYGFFLPKNCTRGQYFDLLGEAMKRLDPLLGR